MKRRIRLDFETQSKEKLKGSKSVGSYMYSIHPSTRPICLYLSNPDDDSHIFGLKFDEINKKFKDLDPEFQYWLEEEIKKETIFSAHNSFFEYCIYNNILVKRYGWPKVPDKQWHCTAAKAAAAALPRKLEDCAKVLKLDKQKDMDGHRAMLAVSAPRRITKNNKETFWTPTSAPDKFKSVYKYCRNDVAVEIAIDGDLPDLTPEEEKVWALDQTVNWRGISVDIDLVNRIVSMIEDEAEDYTAEINKITNGKVTSATQLDKLLSFIRKRGVTLPDLTKGTVNKYLEEGDDLDPVVKRLLEIRQIIAMSSLKKYPVFQRRTAPDGKIRDLTMYHAASTGRAGGTGIQPHNFPRGSIKNVALAIEMIKSSSRHELKMLYGENLSPLFSSCLRGMFIASRGYILEVADYSAIETRVLWWLAEHDMGLQIFYDGRDPYKEMALYLTGKKSIIEIDVDERQLGKAVILGCGYGLGWKKFITTAWDMYKVKVDAATAQHAVNTYRQIHKPVKDLWGLYQEAFITVIETGNSVMVRRCKFFKDGRFLKIRLPSGRCLSYYKPFVRWGTTDWGTPRKEVYFYGVDSKTKKWKLEKTYGGKIVENVVQAVARDIMENGKRLIEDSGRRMLLTVHDEIMSETIKGTEDIKAFEKLICQVPAWAKGCPISASGYSDERYKKG